MTRWVVDSDRLLHAYQMISTHTPPPHHSRCAEKYGSSIVLRIAVVVWSLFTLLTPIAAHTSLWALYLVRFGMGLGEGALLPAIHAALGRWVPVAERTRCVTFVTSGQLVGTVIALGSSPITSRNWASTFYFFGLCGFVWALCAAYWYTSLPESHPRISHREKAYIIATRSQSAVPTADGAAHTNSNTARETRCTRFLDDWIVRVVANPFCAFFCLESPAQAPLPRPIHHSRQYRALQSPHPSPPSSPLPSSPLPSSSPSGMSASRPRPIPKWYRLIFSQPMLAAFAALVCHNWGWYILLGWMPKYLHTLGADVGKHIDNFLICIIAQ